MWHVYSRSDTSSLTSIRTEPSFQPLSEIAVSLVSHLKMWESFLCACVQECEISSRESDQILYDSVCLRKELNHQSSKSWKKEKRHHHSRPRCWPLLWKHSQNANPTFWRHVAERPIVNTNLWKPMFVVWELGLWLPSVILWLMVSSLAKWTQWKYCLVRRLP